MEPQTLAAMIELSGAHCTKCGKGLMVVETQWPAQTATLTCSCCGYVEMEEK